MRSFYISIGINASSYDYNMLKNYLLYDPLIKYASVSSAGFVIIRSFIDDDMRARWLKDIILLDIDDISVWEILYQEST